MYQNETVIPAAHQNVMHCLVFVGGLSLEQLVARPPAVIAPPTERGMAAQSAGTRQRWDAFNARNGQIHAVMVTLGEVKEK